MPSGAGKYHSGFTQLESACISLRETAPGLPDWLNALIKRAQIREAAVRIAAGLVARFYETNKVDLGREDPLGDFFKNIAAHSHLLATALVERCEREQK